MQFYLFLWRLAWCCEGPIVQQLFVQSLDHYNDILHLGLLGTRLKWFRWVPLPGCNLAAVISSFDSIFEAILNYREVL